MKSVLKVVGVGLLVIVVCAGALILFSADAGEPSNRLARGDANAPANEPDDEPEPADDELTALKKRANKPTDDVTAAWDDYRAASAWDEPALSEKLAQRLSETALAHADASELADITLELHGDGMVEIAETMLDPAWQRMRDEEIIFSPEGESVEDIGTPPEPDPRFLQIIELLDWTEYERPTGFDQAELHEVDGIAEYRGYMAENVEPLFERLGRYPPAVVQRLTELHDQALEAYEKLAARDAQDGFAFKARRAWIRFRESNAQGGKIDRAEDQRPFSPQAMGREGEDFGQVWTYTYWKPFVVYMEQPVDPVLREEIPALLRALGGWFRENYAGPFELERRKPAPDPDKAEQEGWPLEIVLFESWDGYERYISEALGNPRRVPDAFYSEIFERVVACSEGWDGENALRRRSQFVKNVFLMLSDHYTAGPQFTTEEMQARPRYPSLLIENGLAEYVAGLTREGSGRDAGFEFGQLNPAMLDAFRSARKQFEGKLIFRLRDLPGCRDGGQTAMASAQRAIALDIHPREVSSIAMSLYTPTAWTAVCFFENFEREGEHPYREAWREFVRLSFNGELQLESYDDEAGVQEFKELFNIQSDEDWDTLEAEWLEFTNSLQLDD